MNNAQLLDLLHKNDQIHPVGVNRSDLMEQLGGSTGRSASKYHNVPVNDHMYGHFDSTGEYNRFLVLLSWQAMGLLADLVRQPPFVLQDKFVGLDGVKHRAITWTADFQYTQDGMVVIEDFKGAITPMFAQKYKLFIYRYPTAHLFVNPNVQGRYSADDLVRLRHSLRTPKKR